ncbi:MAG: NADH-quinone oxidoreductase subunit M [Acidimicrobiales bacterium]|jgi:NADH-quinone oxidoreductase subunit M
MSSFPYLTVLVLVPAVAAVVLPIITSLVTPDNPAAERRVVQAVGWAGVLVTLGISIAVLVKFTSGSGGFQLVSSHAWISSLGIRWTLGVDGISLFLVLMTTVLFPIALAGAGERRNDTTFVAWLLLLEAGCLGSFLSLDLLIFFLFFELTLVPVYFIVAAFGHERRGYAATKFFLYTLGASAFLLVGILALVAIHADQTGVTTFDVRALASTHLSPTAGVLLFLAFTAAFAVKAPIFPFHTWSPDAYRESPVAGTVILAGVMAKLGTYGIVRFDLELFPKAVVTLAPLLLTLGVIGIIYGGIVAAVQRDLKRLVAYSSLAHIGFIVVGAFALTGPALSGAVLQMVNHGVYTAALFLLIALIYRRSGSFSTRDLSGLQSKAPVLAGMFTIVMLASIGVPGLNGFVGEFLILSGTFLTHRWWAVVATGGVVIAAIYLLWAYQQVFHGKPTAAEEGFKEITWKESAYMAPLIAVIVLIGVFPGPLLSRITPSVDLLVQHVEQVGHARVPPAGQPAATVSLTRARVGTGEARAGADVALATADVPAAGPVIGVNTAGGRGGTR